jgi:membrane protein DedA with SNARE-associated domain
VGLPVPDETLLAFVGYLSFKGILQLEAALATAFLGSACGITLSYAVGRFLGLPAIIKFAPRFHIGPEQLALSKRWVGRWGKYFLLMAYFIPGDRHIAALVLGALLLPPTIFARYAYSGALMWSGTFIGLGYLAGEEWKQLSAGLHRTSLMAAFVVILTIFIGIMIVRWRSR